MLQLVGLVVTLITLPVSDVSRSASCVYVRSCIRTRVRANASRAYLEKRTVSLSRVVGVGIAFVGMRICPHKYTRIHICINIRVLSRETPFARRFCEMRRGDFAIFFPPAQWRLGVARVSRNSRSKCSRKYHKIEWETATSPVERTLYSNSVELIRHDRCEYEIVLFAPYLTQCRFGPERIYAMRLLESPFSCCQRRRIV